MVSALSGATDAELFASIAPYTKSSVERLAAMAEAIRSIDREGMPGDIVECGVWRGGNIILSRMLSPGRICWLYDTFNGMTRPRSVDRTRSGRSALDSYNRKVERGQVWAAASVGEVRANLDHMGVLNNDRLIFIEGDVEVTLNDPENVPDKIALLRLDTDWHDSTKIELEVLYPKLVPGGYLIVDDYGHWMGARKAVDDYLGNIPRTPIDYTAIMIRKPC